MDDIVKSDDGPAENNVHRNSPHCIDNDDDMNEPANPNQPEKRLKMDNDSCQDTESLLPSSDSISDNAEKDDNGDSGICAEKSESTLSEDPFVSNGDNSKDAAIQTSPSTSSTSFAKFSASIKKTRNYRRRTADSIQSSDSDDCLSDKYDIENKDKRSTKGNSQDASDSRPIVTQKPPSASVCSETTKSEFAYGSDGDGDSNKSDLDSSSITDSDDWTDVDTSTQNGDNSDYDTPVVLLRKKPDYDWFIIKELMRREIGIGFGPGKGGRNNSYFERSFYGSLLAVQKLELMYKLDKHDGCVNSMGFHPEGHLLVSGSDDLNIIIWDWATNTPLHTVRSGHKGNVFQSKFLYLNAGNQLNIASCARDGQVRLTQISPSGCGKNGEKANNAVGGILRQRLAQHSRAAHKLHVSPAEPHIITSAGEDGIVFLSDVRSDKPSVLVGVRERNTSVPLYSIQGHPLDPKEFIVSGSDKFVRVFDRRKAGTHAKPVHLYCPSFFQKNPGSVSKKRTSVHLYITCAVYNHVGSEILATYNDDDIYLFDAVLDRYNKERPSSEGFSHWYSGHRNSATFKGVSFFGPQSEFVVSGSDCGNIYIWDKKTEAIVQWMMGDEGGVVNCIESHPRFPIMATCGLDKDVKIWVPSNENEPSLKGLKEAVKANDCGQMRSPLTSVPLASFLSGASFRVRSLNSPGDDHSGEDGEDEEGIQYGGNVCTAF